MSDIVVGSVAVDIVPSTTKFRRDLDAKVQGIQVRVGVTADTEKAREEIKRTASPRSTSIRVKVDDAGAKTQLAALQNSLRDKSLALDLSTAEAKAKISDLKVQLAAVKSGSLDLDDTVAKARIAEIQAQIKSLRGSLTVDTAPARAEIDRLRADIAAKRIRVKAQADTAEAEVKLDEVARTRTANVRAKVDKSTISGFGALATSIIALGPALIPITAAVGGLALALGAPLAIAGAGATVFGFLSAAAIKQTDAQNKKIQALAKSVASAKTALDNTRSSASASAANSLASAQASAAASVKAAQVSSANATTASAQASAAQRVQAAHAALSAREASIAAGQAASIAGAQRKYNAALQAYRDAVDGLTPAQKKFLNAQAGIKSAFQHLIVQIGPELLGPPTQAINILIGVLPKLKPIIGATSGAITGLLRQVGQAVNSPDFAKFVAAFSKQLGPDITAFGKIAGNVFGGVSKLVVGLGQQFGRGVLDNLVKLSGSFASFGASAGHSKVLRDFVDYFHRVGPQVGDTLLAVGRAIGHIVKALEPLGPVALDGIKLAANALSKIPVPVLTGLAGAFAAIAVAAKVGGGVGSLAKSVSSIASGSVKLAHGTQNVFSALTGGLIPNVESKYGKGVTPVYVTNKQFTGPPGAAGSAESTGSTILTKTSKVGNLIGITGVVTLAVGTVLLNGKIIRDESTPGPVKPGNLTPQQQRNFDRNRLNSNTGLLGSEDNAQIRSVATRADALRANLATASRSIDLIGPHADQAFGQASKDVLKLSIQLAELKDPLLKARLDDTSAIRELERLQAWRLNDKTLTIRIEQEIDRSVGPGGGIGRPTGAAPRAFTPSSQPAAPSGRTASGTSAPLVNIEHASIADTNDLLRKSGDAVRAKMGGGVYLPPSTTARLG